MKIRFIQNITIIIICFCFSYSKNYSCLEIDSMITARYNQGDYEIAHNIAKKNKEKDDCNTFYYIRLADVFKKFDDFGSTRNMYNIAMKKSTEDEYKEINLEYKKLSFLSSQINFIQSVYLSDGDKDKALSNYKDLINGNGVWDNGEPDANGDGVWTPEEKYTDENNNNLYDEGEIYADDNLNGKWDAAEEFTDWQFDDIGLLHLYVADIYKNSKDYPNAIIHLKKALSINPYVKKYNEYMGVISKLIAQQGNDFLRLNKLDQAIEQYTLSLSIDSSESVIHYNLANAYFKQDKFEQAQKSFKKVIELDPDKFKAVHKVGVCYQKLNRHDEAVTEFRRAIGVIERLEENFMSPYHSLGVSFMELGLYRDAIQILNAFFKWMIAFG